MSDLSILQSLIADRWVGTAPARRSPAPSTAATIHHTHADEIDFGEALRHARRTGVPALLAMDFQQRAARLKALAAYLNEQQGRALRDLAPHRRDAQRQLGRHRGRHRHALRLRRRWAATSCPRATSCTKGRRCRSARRGSFAGTHILVPRGGVAVHINAFNFPVWGLLEKFAPTFLAGMPCIAKPATATSYLTEALVRMMIELGPAARRAACSS